MNVVRTLMVSFEWSHHTLSNCTSFMEGWNENSPFQGQVIFDTISVKVCWERWCRWNCDLRVINARKKAFSVVPKASPWRWKSCAPMRTTSLWGVAAKWLVANFHNRLDLIREPTFYWVFYFIFPIYVCFIICKNESFVRSSSTD